MIKVGDIAKDMKKFTKEDVEKYAELTGDFNPIHFDSEFTSKTIFKKPIVHGPLVITLITTMFANKLPGSGSVYLSQDVKYLHPVFVNDCITGILEVIEITEKNHILLKTTCLNDKGVIVIKGIARLKKM